MLDGIRPSSSDKEYTLVILGEALKDEELNAAKESLYRNYTALSPYAFESKNFSISEAKQSNWNWSLILAGHSWGDSTGTNFGTSVDVTDYKVKHTLDVIEKQMERFKQCIQNEDREGLKDALYHTREQRLKMGSIRSVAK